MRLQRDSEGPDQPTFGVLIRDDNTVVCQTLELPWRANQHGVSRIPAGAYTAYRFVSPHIGYELFQIRGVPDRQGIDIHKGNTVKDTEGCVILGMTRGTINGEPAVLHSADAFSGFMQMLDGVNDFPLLVEDVAPVVVADA